jgi:hypothetical protein
MLQAARMNASTAGITGGYLIAACVICFIAGFMVCLVLTMAIRRRR